MLYLEEELGRIGRQYVGYSYPNDQDVATALLLGISRSQVR